MLVYGSLALDGMVLLDYDNGFEPSLAFFWMPWYVGMSILFWSFGIVGWISKSRVELVSRFIPKGLGNP